MSTDRVVRDGKVAVLYSLGHGVGWYSWNTECPRLLFDPEIVAAVEAVDFLGAKARAATLYPDAFLGGVDGLCIEWVELGRRFRIDEYDGSEGVVIDTDDAWMTA